MYTAYLFIFLFIHVEHGHTQVCVGCACRDENQDGGRIKHDEMNLFEYTRQWGGEEGNTEEKGRGSIKKKSKQNKESKTQLALYRHVLVFLFSVFIGIQTPEKTDAPRTPHIPKIPPKGGGRAGVRVSGAVAVFLICRLLSQHLSKFVFVCSDEAISSVFLFCGGVGVLAKWVPPKKDQQESPTKKH